MNVNKFQTPGAGIVVGIEITCEDLKDEPSFRFSNACSPGCEEQPKLFFRPGLRGSSIHASVCAGRFEFVRSLSREWWARKAAPVLDWDEDKIREQIDEEWARKVQRANVSGSRSATSSEALDVVDKECGDCGGPLDKDENCKRCHKEPVVDDGNWEDLFK